MASRIYRQYRHPCLTLQGMWILWQLTGNVMWAHAMARAPWPCELEKLIISIWFWERNSEIIYYTSNVPLILVFTLQQPAEAHVYIRSLA